MKKHTYVVSLPNLTYEHSIYVFFFLSPLTQVAGRATRSGGGTITEQVKGKIILWISNIFFSLENVPVSPMY